MKTFLIGLIFSILIIIILTNLIITANADSLNQAIRDRKEFIEKGISKHEASLYFDKLDQYNRFTINKWFYQFSPEQTRFWAEYDMSRSEYNQVKRHVKWWVKKNKVRDKREMALRIRKYLSDNMKYDYELKDSSYTQFGAFKGKGTCQGMTLYAKDMFDEARIGNRIVVDWDKSHSWNEILIDGRRYKIDFTIECQWGDLIKGVKYQTFLLGG